MSHAKALWREEKIRKKGIISKNENGKSFVLFFLPSVKYAPEGKALILNLYEMGYLGLLTTYNLSALAPLREELRKI